MRLTAAVIVLATLQPGVALAGDDTCVPPLYRTIHDYVSNIGRGSIDISLKPTDVTLRNLLCLAATIRNERPTWKEVTAFVFSSEETALRFNPTGLNLERGDSRQDVRALISFADSKADAPQTYPSR